jgi:mevalonate pyrophosphate decarboxylase
VLNRRKTVIGYITYVLATRLAKLVIRQRTRQMRSSAAATAGKASSRRLPLAAGLLAVAAGAAALVASRGRRSQDD